MIVWVSMMLLENVMALVNSMGTIKIVEIVRSGALGISRGKDSLEIK